MILCYREVWSACTVHSKTNKPKNLKIIFLRHFASHWRKEQDPDQEPELDRYVSGTDPDPYQNIMDPQHWKHWFRGTGTVRYLERSQVVHSHPSGGSSGTVMPAEACKPQFINIMFISYNIAVVLRIRIRCFLDPWIRNGEKIRTRDEHHIQFFRNSF